MSTTTSTDHAATVRGFYEAFARGDVEAILGRLADDVAWDAAEPRSAAADRVPYLRPRNGRDDVVGFFAALADLEFERFDVGPITAAGDRVVAEIRVALTVRATGRGVEDRELHVWDFAPDGRVARFRHVVDTAKHIAAQ